MRKKPSNQNDTLIMVPPSATPPKYHGCSRCPITAVSTSPSNGMVMLDKTIGMASQSTCLCNAPLERKENVWDVFTDNLINWVTRLAFDNGLINHHRIWSKTGVIRYLKKGILETQRCQRFHRVQFLSIGE